MEIKTPLDAVFWMDRCWQCSAPIPDDHVAARDLAGHRLCDACNAELVEAREARRKT